MTGEGQKGSSDNSSIIKPKGLCFVFYNRVYNTVITDSISEWNEPDKLLNICQAEGDVSTASSKTMKGGWEGGGGHTTTNDRTTEVT